MKARWLQGIAWGLSILVVVLAVAAWMQGGGGAGLGDLNIYLLFPLFGLLAFSLMWTHYAVGALRRASGVDKLSLKTYFGITGWLAFGFIVLHPSLLIVQLWRDGQGLPPNSYLNYVGPNLKWAVAFGTFAFIMFLAFETKRWFNKKGWWPIIEYGNVVAMFAIIAHALALGNTVSTGWYRAVWLVYAVTLLLSVSYIYYLEAKQATKEGKFMKKVIGIAIVAALVIGGGVFAYTQMNKNDEQSATVVDTSVDEENLAIETQDQEVYTAFEVADHNTETDCWTIIDGSVYDITTYILRHPGGDDILAACGTDGTTLFTQRTDSSGNEVGSGTPHSSTAQSQLQQFKIGTVSQ